MDDRMVGKHEKPIESIATDDKTQERSIPQFSSIIWAAALVAVAKNKASMPPGQC
jgi:hypothetical protein